MMEMTNTLVSHWLSGMSYTIIIYVLHLCIPYTLTVNATNYTNLYDEYKHKVI